MGSNTMELGTWEMEKCGDGIQKTLYCQQYCKHIPQTIIVTFKKFLVVEECQHFSYHWLVQIINTIATKLLSYKN